MAAVIWAIPADRDLVKIAESPLDGGKGHRLHRVAAAAWRRMVADAARDGVGLWPASGGAPCFRSLTTQRAMHSTPSAFGLNPSMTVSMARVGASTHQDGRRIDVGSVPPAADLDRFGVDGRKRRAWLLEHAEDYGFARSDFWPTPERDHNHFTHDGKTVGPPLPAPAAIENEELMPAREKITAELETEVGPEFTTLLRNKKGDVSLAFGPCRVSIVANIAARSLPEARLDTLPVPAGTPASSAVRLAPGAVVQVRFVRAEVAAGKTTTRSEGVGLELVGNGGSAFGQLVGEIDLGKNERLRMQALTTAPDPVLVGFSASIRVQK